MGKIATIREQIEKSCTKCGKSKPINSFLLDKHRRIRQCKDCRNEYSRWYNQLNKDEINKRQKKRYRDKKQDINAKTKEYYNKIKKEPEHKLKVKAHNVASGLKPCPCVECGTTKRVEAHHPDYSKPSEVMWLCSQHHRFEHFKKAQEVQSNMEGKKK